MIQKLTSITQLLTSVLLALAVLSFPANSDPLKLAPFKDELFKYPGVLETGFKGDFVRVKYDKLIDIHKRDVVLEREVKRKYVSERTRWQRSAKRLNLSNFQMRYFAVGKTRKPVKFIVIYIHGSGGNRFQGVNDWTFGGNFNRIQNLTYRNNGLYLSPSFQDFKERGASQVASLILKYSKISPAAPIYIACGAIKVSCPDWVACCCLARPGMKDFLNLMPLPADCRFIWATAVGTLFTLGKSSLNFLTELKKETPPIRSNSPFLTPAHTLAFDPQLDDVDEKRLRLSTVSNDQLL